MKIAFIVDAFPTLSETFILNQITGLLDMGHDVEIFAAGRGQTDVVQKDVKDYKLLSHTHYFNEIPANPLIRFLKFLPLFFKNLPFHQRVIMQTVNVLRFGQKALSLRLFFLTVPFLENGPFDIIQCHFGPNGNIGALLKEVGLPGKLVAMFHGYDIRKGIKEGGQIYEPLFRHADCLLAISQANYDHLINFGAAPGTIVIHPVGIDVAQFSSSRRPHESKRPEGIIILTVARLVKEKGIEDGIRAIGLLHQEHPEVKFQYQIIGSGPQKDFLQRLVEELNLSSLVKFMGPQDHDHVIEAMNKADIFFLPSHNEVLPVVLMEAQASALPVVATNVGSIAEIVAHGQSGYLVPAGDIQGMMKMLRYLLLHPDKQQEMGKIGASLVRERYYGIKKLNMRLVDIYESLNNR